MKNEKNGRLYYSLCGEWERWIGDKLIDKINVPSSYRPIGAVSLRRKFQSQLPDKNSRVILRYEGVAHYAVVRINGAEVGTMGPWTPYEFDVTGNIKVGENEIETEITDWQTPLGQCGAWEAYGGIIRDVFIEYRPDPYISNAHLQYKIDMKKNTLRCFLDVYLQSAKKGSEILNLKLTSGSESLHELTKTINFKNGENKIVLEWTMKLPQPWSPESPNLYDLNLTLSSGVIFDQYSLKTGFRDLRINGNMFMLNGRQLVLCGVGRHDIWFNQGHTMTDEQIWQDMRMIKDMGANFVRLVHYPHDRRVVEAADRLGLFVTEESGLVWLTFAKTARKVFDVGFENLERTIKRDWNSPSLFAILLGNECHTTVSMLKEGRERVRKLIPDTFVSFAHAIPCKSRDELKAVEIMYDKSGLDFYTRHPYTYEMTTFRNVARRLNKKPLFFTEWGGRAIGQSPIIMDATINELGMLVEESMLAGHSFWGWSDLPEFARCDTEMEDGILKSGVVTEDRKIRQYVHDALVGLFRRLPKVKKEPSLEPEILPIQNSISKENSSFEELSLQSWVKSHRQLETWAELEEQIQWHLKTYGFTVYHWSETGEKFWLWDKPELSIGNIPFKTPLYAEKTCPLLITPRHRKIEIKADIIADRLHFLGNVTLPEGYPVTDRLGENVAQYVIEYTDGDKQIVPLRWGLEIARSNMIAIASRINPETAYGRRVLVYTKHPLREIYQTRLLSIDIKHKKIERIICQLLTPKPSRKSPLSALKKNPVPQLEPSERTLLLYGITAEKYAN